MSDKCPKCGGLKPIIVGCRTLYPVDDLPEGYQINLGYFIEHGRSERDAEILRKLEGLNCCGYVEDIQFGKLVNHLGLNIPKEGE